MACPSWQHLGIFPSKRMYRSQDYGKTADYIGTEFPYGTGYLYGGCLVIIDDQTVFVAGGKSGNQQTFKNYTKT